SLRRGAAPEARYPADALGQPLSSPTPGYPSVPGTNPPSPANRREPVAGVGCDPDAGGHRARRVTREVRMPRPEQPDGDALISLEFRRLDLGVLRRRVADSAA